MRGKIDGPPNQYNINIICFLKIFSVHSHGLFVTLFNNFVLTPNNVYMKAYIHFDGCIGLPDGLFGFGSG